MSTIRFALAVSLAVPFSCAAQQRDSAGTSGPIVYDRSNGGPGFSAHEKLTLNTDGSVVYETDGPFSLAGITQNRVGEFATRVAPGTYAKLAAELTNAMPKGPHQTTFPVDSGIERIGFEMKGAASLTRAAGAPSAVFDALVKQIVPLEEAARPHPVRALELSCARQPDALVCRIQSVGPSPMAAPDLSLSQFSCFHRDRHMQYLDRPAGVDGSASRRELPTGQAVEIRFPLSACEFHVVVQATGALLVSNTLTP